METNEPSPREQSAKSIGDLIHRIVMHMVDEPEQIKVELRHGEQTSVIELSVAKTDLGKVIGKQGRNAQALRTILNAASTKLKLRAVLEIIE